VIEQYCKWAGECTEIREFYLGLFNLWDNAEAKIEVAQVENLKFKFPEGIEVKGRGEFT
jgi:hypothetical protein